MIGPTKRKHNLPGLLVRLIGRSSTVASIAARLPRQRFLTIVGPGGIGKTSVAVAVAQNLVNAYEDGVWLVDLAPILKQAWSRRRSLRRSGAKFTPKIRFLR